VIPWLAVVRVGGPRRTVRLWLPLFLLWPLIPLLAAAGLVAARAYGVATAGLPRAAWQVVRQCRGTHVRIDVPEFAFHIRLI
jgi:hypothetical protein